MTTVDELGRHAVLDQDGALLGTLLQTSPQSDGILGFSGPTNLLVGFDQNEQIVKVEILSSQDTREHVEQIRRAPEFLAAWEGLNRQQAARGNVPVDAVSGATLTSLAIQTAIIERLGGNVGSLRFPDPPTLDIARKLFTSAARLRPAKDANSVWDVLDGHGAELGAMLRTSPVADNLVGYQGPSEAWVGVDSEQRVVGLLVGKSYDNEPYVSYVREDRYFLTLFNGRSLDELAELTTADLEVEGVSGATMTSMAIADGILKTASHQRQARTENAAAERSFAWRYSRAWGTIAVVVAGTLIGLTSLRGNRNLRRVFQVLLIGYLGLVNGDMVSQALIVGWAQHGLPWQLAGGLVALTAAAFALPVVTGRNVYCQHLCPHGAVQQLIRNRIPWRLSVSRRLSASLRLLPALLLFTSLLVGMGVLSLSLVDIEPFDAWVFYVAGPVTLAIAIVGLVLSCFVPMAYCRFGCPTGALLNYVRFNSRSGQWTASDTLAVTCLIVALVLYWI